MDKLLTMADLVAITQVHRQTITRWIREGRFPPPILLGGPESQAKRWKESVVEEWVNSRKLRDV